MDSLEILTLNHDSTEEVYSAIGEGIFAEIVESGASSSLKLSSGDGSGDEDAKYVTDINEFKELQTRECDYINKLPELRHRNSQLLACKTTLSEQINILEAELEKSKREAQIVTKKLRSQEDKNKLLHQEIQQNSFDLSNFEKKLEEALQQLDWEKCRSRNFDSSQEKLIQRIEEGHAKIEELEKINEQLKKDLTDSSQTARNQIKDLESTNDSLVQELLVLRSSHGTPETNEGFIESPVVPQLALDFTVSEVSTPINHPNIQEEMIAAGGMSPSVCLCEQQNFYGFPEISTNETQTDCLGLAYENKELNASTKNLLDSKRIISNILRSAEVLMVIILIILMMVTMVIHTNIAIVSHGQSPFYTDLDAPWWRFITITPSNSNPY